MSFFEILEMWTASENVIRHVQKHYFDALSMTPVYSKVVQRTQICRKIEPRMGNK